MKITCIECHGEFNRIPSQIKRSENHFCSRTCSSIYNNRGKTRHLPKARVCRKCRNEYSTIKGHRSIHFCQNCAVKTHNRPGFTKTLTLADYYARLSVKDKHPSWRASHIRLLNRTWNVDIRKLPCANCGYDKHVELAHKKSVSSFPLTTTLGVVNSSDNNIQLCPNCHWEFDHGLLHL